MKYSIIIILLILFFVPTRSVAQIENVIVETYYISDAIDATDTTGGLLAEGSKTYRVYIDMGPGSRLLKIYGDPNHALKVSSTNIFFNNKADGQSFGKDFSKNRLQENTVALDSWLTLGQTTRVASKTYFGVPKSSDNDGSIIGGANNDGGSAGISGGLLTNSETNIGIPLTTSDGLDTMINVPTSWADYGIVDLITGEDTTVFGSLKSCSEFISYNAGLQNSGVTGVNPDSNIVLIAQLTTKGDLSFEFNLEIEEKDGASTRVVKYVANNNVLLSDERLSPFLKYPFICGCKDPDFVEYNQAYACSNPDSCRTLIVYGCTDTLACNFDPEANFNIPALCCYPGYCSDRDISVVCPQLSVERNIPVDFELYPNPAGNYINVKGVCEDQNEINYFIYDQYGSLVIEKKVDLLSGRLNQQIDISDYAEGIYIFRIITEKNVVSKIFVKGK